jgi:hypothetical protein
MKTALYTLWFALPCIFFLLALWGTLETIGNRQKKNNSKELAKQGLFVLACSCLCVVIDLYILESIVTLINSSWFTLGFAETLILPLVLYIGAKLLGGSEEIRISKAPVITTKKKLK